MDRGTIDVYERRASDWIAQRGPVRLSAARRLARQVRAGGRRADLGCGPGWHAPALGRPLVALDASRAMLDAVALHAPHALRVRGDLQALPFARGALAGAWASKSYVHVPERELPLALAELHAALEPGAPLDLHLFGKAPGESVGDAFPGRRFAFWERERLRDVVLGAGFAVESLRARTRAGHAVTLLVRARRARTLSDTVGPGMRLLVCGLNPSLYAADVGVAFARPGNRFWPAARRARLVSRERDPLAALREDGIGLTDLVKRATRRADELEAAEYREGLARVERLAAWLGPAAVCFVGLDGWRRAVDRRARPGPQPPQLGGRPVYLMPSTSGLNAHASLTDLTRHLRAAARLAQHSR